MKLAIGQVRDLARGKILHFYAFQSRHHALFLRRVHASEKADFIPQPHRRQFKHRHRLAAVNVRLLRQISNVLARHIFIAHAARVRLLQTHNGFEQSRFARAVRPENRPHLAIFKHHIDMVHHRPALIADRQILHHDTHGDTAQKYTAHNATNAASAISSLCSNPVNNTEFISLKPPLPEYGLQAV